MNTLQPARSRSNRSNNNQCQPARSRSNQSRSRTNQSRSRTSQSRSRTNQSRSNLRRNGQAQTVENYEDEEDDLVFSPLRIGSFLGAILLLMYGTYGIYASIGTNNSYIKPLVYCCFWFNLIFTFFLKFSLTKNILFKFLFLLLYIS